MSLRELMTSEDIKRFEVKFTRTEGCWIWNAATDSHGYGVFRPHGTAKMIGAHRVAYELYIGEIPAPLTIDHLCKVKRCMNPSHMEIVSRSENSRRTRQTQCMRGHQFSTENTYVSNAGQRQCCACYKIRTGHLLQPRIQ